MHVAQDSCPTLVRVLSTLAAAVLLLAGCGFELRVIGADGSTSKVSISVSGDETSVTVRRPQYFLRMECEGKATFAEDESDIVALEPGGEFELEETIDGVDHDYRLTADGAGALTRTYARDGDETPWDAAAARWLAEALPRMFRESGLDAEERVARLLAKGGPRLVLSEVELPASDHAKASYLGRLLGAVDLDGAETELALAAAAQIGSDYELRRALGLALKTQELDAARLALLLDTARSIDSDYELAELLTEVADRMPDDERARSAWRRTAEGIDSDFELRRTLEAGFEADGGDARFAATLVELASERIGSDFELRTVLEKVAARAGDPALAVAYLAAVREIGSDFEQRTTLVTLLERAELDTSGLLGVLDATARIGSDFEKRTVLEEIAGHVGADPELSRRYREVAHDMGNHERGEALRALDDATR